VKAIQEKLGVKAKGRQVLGENGSYQLRDPVAYYTGNIDSENSDLS
jgi:hypothetical protein